MHGCMCGNGDDQHDRYGVLMSDDCGGHMGDSLI